MRSMITVNRKPGEDEEVVECVGRTTGELRPTRGRVVTRLEAGQAFEARAPS